MKIIKKNIIITLMVVVMVLFCTPVFAAKVRTVSANQNYNKAKSIKIGTNIVRAKWKQKTMYVKFIPSKTGKYVFTISAFKTSSMYYGKNIDNMSIGVYEFGISSPVPMRAKTERGTSYSTYVCTNDSWNISPRFKSVYDYKTKRTLSLKLQKGKTYWLGFQTGSGKKATCLFKICVKKK